jgi:hypothetical protein
MLVRCQHWLVLSIIELHTSWARNVSRMKRSCQLRRLLRSLGLMLLDLFNSEAGKGMRMAYANAIVFGNTGLNQNLNRKFRTFQAHVIGTEGCLRRLAESCAQ